MRRGFTLPEILVVMFLSLTVLTMLAGLLVPSVWMWRVESARGDAQQAVMMVTTRLQRMLLNSQVETVTIAQDKKAISFQEIVESGVPFDATTGMPIMQNRFRVFFLDAKKRVVMKTWGPSEGPPVLSGYDFTDTAKHPQRLSLPDLEQIRATPNGKEQVIARNVSVFNVTDADDDLTLLDPPIRCIVECAVDTSQQGAVTNQTCRMQVSVNPRSLRW